MQRTICHTVFTNLQPLHNLYIRRNNTVWRFRKWNILSIFQYCNPSQCRNSITHYNEATLFQKVMIFKRNMCLTNLFVVVFYCTYVTLLYSIVLFQVFVVVRLRYTKYLELYICQDRLVIVTKKLINITKFLLETRGTANGSK